VVQLLNRVRVSPGFLAVARQAVAAYKTQMQLADGAIQGLLRSNDLQPGIKLSWTHRPDPTLASPPPPPPPPAAAARPRGGGGYLT
jgi:hypothetical protein